MFLLLLTIDIKLDHSIVWQSSGRKFRNGVQSLELAGQMKIWMLPVKYEYGSNSWAHILGRERHEEQIEIHDKNVNKITFNFLYVFRSVDACFFLLMVAKLGFPGVSKPILFLLHFPRNHQLPPAQEILWSCDLRMCWGIFKFEQVLFHSHF